MVAMCLNMSTRTVKPQESNQKPHMIELTVRIASAGHGTTVCMHLWAGIVEHVRQCCCLSSTWLIGPAHI